MFLICMFLILGGKYLAFQEIGGEVSYAVQITAPKHIELHRASGQYGTHAHGLPGSTGVVSKGSGPSSFPITRPRQNKPGNSSMARLVQPIVLRGVVWIGG